MAYSGHPVVPQQRFPAFMATGGREFAHNTAQRPVIPSPPPHLQPQGQATAYHSIDLSNSVMTPVQQPHFYPSASSGHNVPHFHESTALASHVDPDDNRHWIECQFRTIHARMNQIEYNSNQQNTKVLDMLQGILAKISQMSDSEKDFLKAIRNTLVDRSPGFKPSLDPGNELFRELEEHPPYDAPPNRSAVSHPKRAHHNDLSISAHFSPEGQFIADDSHNALSGTTLGDSVPSTTRRNYQSLAATGQDKSQESESDSHEIPDQSPCQMERDRSITLSPKSFVPVESPNSRCHSPPSFNISETTLTPYQAIGQPQPQQLVQQPSSPDNDQPQGHVIISTEPRAPSPIQEPPPSTSSSTLAIDIAAIQNTTTCANQDAFSAKSMTPLSPLTESAESEHSDDDMTAFQETPKSPLRGIAEMSSLIEPAIPIRVSLRKKRRSWRGMAVPPPVGPASLPPIKRRKTQAGGSLVRTGKPSFAKLPPSKRKTGVKRKSSSQKVLPTSPVLESHPTTNGGTGAPSHGKAPSLVNQAHRDPPWPLVPVWPPLKVVGPEEQAKYEAQIQCSLCGRWFHYCCINQEPLEDSDQPYFCPWCLPNLPVAADFAAKHPLSETEQSRCSRPGCDIPSFEPERIVGMRMKPLSGGYEIEWLIKWAGYDVADCTWEKLDERKDLIDHFFVEAQLEGHDCHMRELVLLKEAEVLRVSAGWSYGLSG